MDVYGLAVSEGTVVSTQDGPVFASSIIFDANNRPTVIHTNWPATSLTECLRPCRAILTGRRWQERRLRPAA
jgi:hypothetical protein